MGRLPFRAGMVWGGNIGVLSAPLDPISCKQNLPPPCRILPGYGYRRRFLAPSGGCLHSIHPSIFFFFVFSISPKNPCSCPELGAKLTTRSQQAGMEGAAFRVP